MPPETTLTRCANADGAEPSARNFDYAARYCATTASSFLTLSRLEHFRKLHLARRARVLGAAADPAAVRRGRDFDRRKRKKESTQSWSRTHRDSLGCASPFFVLVSLLFVLFFFPSSQKERERERRISVYLGSGRSVSARSQQRASVAKPCMPVTVRETRRRKKKRLKKYTCWCALLWPERRL